MGMTDTSTGDLYMPSTPTRKQKASRQRNFAKGRLLSSYDSIMQILTDGTLIEPKERKQLIAVLDSLRKTLRVWHYWTGVLRESDWKTFTDWDKAPTKEVNKVLKKWRKDANLIA